MTEADPQWSDAVEQRLRAHLDAVDRALASRGVAFSQRRSVTDDVENQLREMISVRSAAAPTLADVEAVLAELDPPELYAEPAGEGSPVTPVNASPQPVRPEMSLPEAPASPKPILKNLILTVVFHSALLILVTMAIVQLGSLTVQMMSEIGAKLPPAMVLAINLLWFVKHCFFFIAALFVVSETTCFILFFALRQERMRIARKLWLYGVALIMVAFFVMWAALMFIPLMGFMHQVSGNA